MISAQISLYTRNRKIMPKSIRRELLLDWQSIMQTNYFITGSKTDRIVASDLEISLSELGCCEIFGNADHFLELIPQIVKNAKFKGFEYYWLFFDTQEQTSKTTEYKKRIIKKLKQKDDLDSIHFGGTAK